MKYFTVVVLLLACINISLYSQSISPNNQRYQIYQIDNILLQDDSSSIAFPHPMGDKHNILILDSQTGETWILSNNWNSSGLTQGPALLKTASWQRIQFDTTESQLMKSKFQLLKRPTTK
jgi:hypothetical protein